MVKVINKGLRKPDDPAYQEGWTIATVPQASKPVEHFLDILTPEEKAEVRRHLDKSKTPERTK
jgi:hypothetical protein